MQNSAIDFIMLAFMFVWSCLLFVCSTIVIVSNFVTSDPLSHEGAIIFGCIGAAMAALYMIAESLRGLQRYL